MSNWKNPRCPQCRGRALRFLSCPACNGTGRASPRQRDRIEHARAMRKLQRRLNKAKGREKALKRVLDFERQRGAAWHKRADLNRGLAWQERKAKDTLCAELRLNARLNEQLRKQAEAELENRRAWDKARFTGTIIAAAIAFAWLALWPACEVLS